MDNAHIAARLDDYAALLELAGAGYYSHRAYRRAAELIRATPAPVADLVRGGRVRELRGIGRGIEARLVELVDTGEIEELRELERTVSPQLAAFGRLIGIGAQRAVEIGKTLGIRTVDEFRVAAAEGRLREVPGIGPKTEERIRAALERGVAATTRPVLLHRARALVETIAEELGGVAAGDPRRWKDACTWLAVAAPGGELESVPEIVAMVAPDVGVTVEGIPVELHVAPPESFGTALVRATGSQEWVAALEPLPDAPDEAGVFELLGLPFVPPELREGAPTRDVPELVAVEQIRGDLHVHTTWSDGKASVLEMGDGARARGYEYVAICDHTPNVTVVPGLDADALRRQADEIAAANEVLAPFRILRGAECDIRRDGTLDLPDDVLAELEWVQLSLHAGQRAPRREITARVVEAMRHPAVGCLSHPTGRLIGRRPENALDLERVFEVALETGVALEVNGLAPRLDLSGEHVREALAAGVAIVCSTDAHSVAGLGNMRLSVHTARRGGARPADVLNTGRLRDVLGGRRRA
ncbi:MAG TPA: helix-hairpin-helix domain-containing protein [Gaiellaceae bacterium]|nr:helix-hairpin-helix domain-containing protein [Gaiellaceae bacterium]